MQSVNNDLECIEVSKRFGSVRAVDAVSVDVPAGSMFSILGPSGCGKTTLMRMIAGFESPDGGDIRIKGKSVLATPPNKRNVKMVFQHLALFPMMNVHENIAYGLRCRGEHARNIDKKVQDVLERVALPEVGHREIHQLSGGQRQRIAIARCMVLEPDVLLLDEPLGALDLKLREAMKIELKLLQNQFNTTFVYITHDQSEALVMSDQVAVMNEGRFEQIGTPQSLYHNPSTAFVAGFVGDSNRWEGRVIDVREGNVSVSTDKGLTLFCLSNDRTLNVGDQVAVFVRPEFVSVHRKDTPPLSQSDSGREHLKLENHAAASEGNKQSNQLQGRIGSLLFNGANSRVLVDVQGGSAIEADVVLRDDGRDPRAGDTVELTWPSAQCLCFKL